MSQSRVELEIEYPETDEEPMGETEIHIDWLMQLVQMLRYRYRDQKVYVGGDLFVYFAEGEPQRRVCPDVFVVLDCEPRPRRRIFQTWVEGRVPSAVIELTSRSTRRRDEFIKPETYAEIGVPEYFLYDPTGDYLNPPLQGHRLAGNGYQRIEPDAAGRLACEQLDLFLHLGDDELVLTDRTSGERLLTEAETERRKSEQERAEKERERAEKERERAEKEQERAARLAAEAEVARLRKLLGDDGSKASD